MNNNSYRAKEPGDLRNEAGMLSGPFAPLTFIFFVGRL